MLLPSSAIPTAWLYPKITSLETRRVQEGRKRESPSLHPFPIAGKGGRPLILAAGLPGAQALPLPLPVAPARAEDPGLQYQSSLAQTQKQSWGRPASPSRPAPI